MRTTVDFKSTDLEPLALQARVVQLATENAQDRPMPEDQSKNPAAVQLGRLGGLKGGRARARKLSSKRRSEIARKAAQARYGKRD